MSERIDHAEIAELQISLAISEADNEEATSIVHAMLAQTRATLALVEQQRIANLIALFVPEPDAASMLERAGVNFRRAAAEIAESLGLS